MDTLVRTPLEVFNLSQHLIIPLYQRRYVWDEVEQWEPLWADVRRATELRLGPVPTATHFLGAVVLQSLPPQPGRVPQWAVVDGQQRLTTLQLLMDAAATQFDLRGLTKQVGRLRKLTHNDEDDVESYDEILKVRHSNADHDPFVAVMDAPAPLDYSSLAEPEGRLARAHAYFAQRVNEWLDLDLENGVLRADALVDALRSGLEIVTITLLSTEDSQEIFETLNARGTPLTSADLIKNLLFQRLEAEGTDTKAAYRDHWHSFETPFWEQEISTGRLFQPRSSVFLGQWLISRTGQELITRAFFGRFKFFVEHEWSGTTLELLRTLHTQAASYERWTRDAQGRDPDVDQVALAVYRMDALQLQVAKPLLIWLHEPGLQVPPTDVREAVAAIESWLMRRMMLRLTTADLGRVVAAIIAAFRGREVFGLGVQIRDYLARESTVSTYWPGDSEISGALRDLPAYRAYSRARLRMMLETIEDAERGFIGDRPSRTGTRVVRGQLHIEHLLPRSWKRNWPVDGLAAEIARAEHVDRLGNLTLLTRSLNSEVSNGPWTGPSGKLAALDKHDALLMTREVRREHPAAWDEAAIDERTEWLVSLLLETWSVPAGHVGLTHTPSTADSHVSVAQLIAAGLLEPGMELLPRGDLSVRAVVTDRGWLRVGDQEFDSPSGARKAATGLARNGWTFWRLNDGRRLRDLRDEYSRRNGDS